MKVIHTHTQKKKTGNSEGAQPVIKLIEKEEKKAEETTKRI